MNVNSEGKRIRRTPEEAKSLILRVASDRLSIHGLEGLNISGVARDAGMSHATVIHHFGSTGAMREALLEKMTHDLLSDVIVALNHHQEPARVLDQLFEILSHGGHGCSLGLRWTGRRVRRVANQRACLPIFWMR